MGLPRPAVNARLVARRPEGSLQFEGAVDRQHGWRLVGEGDAHFGRDGWHKAVEQLILHPEYSSSSILRADVEQDIVELRGHSTLPRIKHLNLTRYIRRVLLPKRPKLDRSLQQDCFIYDSKTIGVAILRPECTSKLDIPFYHPQVRSLAFRFVDEQGKKRVEVHVDPFEEDDEFDPIEQSQHRLSRTVISLIELLCKLAWGAENGYKKRVQHDVIVRRSDYQALYLRLRTTYAKKLMDNWAESTDPGKHVFEDLGIAAFVMLLWRDTFEAVQGSEGQWARPDTFVDLGCGNGLLVYLLTCEGYKGFGLDVQPRKSWQVYTSWNDGVDLRQGALDPVGIVRRRPSALLPSKAFLIGNHADELTPWIPLLADRIEDCTGFINIPCCRFQLDGSIFGAAKYEIDEEFLQDAFKHTEGLAQTLSEIDRGPPAEKDTRSRNVAFLRYIDHLHLQAGWHLEKEALRIPSTKNWAIVGRRRIWCKAEHDEAERLRSSTQARVVHLALQYGQTWQARSSTSFKSKHTHE
jgi:tRNASer (uridine44-2'-O)-methyltransferase